MSKQLKAFQVTDLNTDSLLTKTSLDDVYIEPAGKSGKSNLYIGTGSPENQRSNDMRVYFEFMPAGEYSILAKQVGNELRPFETASGDMVSFVEPGVVSPEEVMQNIASFRGIFYWIGRAVGFVGVMISGLFLAFSFNLKQGALPKILIAILFSVGYFWLLISIL